MNMEENIPCPNHSTDQGCMLCDGTGFIYVGEKIIEDDPINQIPKVVNEEELKKEYSQLWMEIYNELDNQAYNQTYHVYEYKAAGQIIRKYFEKIVLDWFLVKLNTSQQNSAKYMNKMEDLFIQEKQPENLQ